MADPVTPPPPPPPGAGSGVGSGVGAEGGPRNLDGIRIEKLTKSAEKPEKGWEGKTARKFEAKAYSEYFDPCQEVATRSLKCLHRNGNKKEMCHDYFQAYRDCKKQWIEDRKEAKRKQSWGFLQDGKPEEK